MLPISWSQWAFGFRRRRKNRFLRWPPWRPSWISDRHDLAIFDLHVTPVLPTKFGVSWPFGSGEEAKNRFSRWRSWRPSWIFDRNDFSYFCSTGHPYASYQVSSQLAQGCRRSRLLKQFLRRMTNGGRRSTNDARRTTDID